MRRSGASPFANPVLIGAVTILVVIVAVFLSYNANSGLPFVPTYEVNVDVPNAANLVRGNEVRIGGARVGAISEITPLTRKNGTVAARLKLKLDKAVDPLPKDSTVVIRPKSLLGLKYVEITRGKSTDGYPAGGTIPVSASKPAEVEFDELIDTFDEPTRKGIAGSTSGFGTALAGRGQSLNEAIGAFRPLLTDLLPVASYLRTDKTDLTGFIKGLGQAAAEVAPAAAAQADLFKQLDTTFAALADVARPFIQDTIAEGPATLDTSIDSFRVQRPFLVDSTALMRDLRPGVRALRQAAPDLSDALRIGRPVLLRTPALDRRLERLLVSLKNFATDDVVPEGVADLTDTAKSLRPTLAYLKPAETQCKYVTNWFRNVSDLLTVGDASGTTQRFIIIATPQGVNNEGSPSSAPANGPGDDNHVHANPYPYTASPGQPNECEAGNESYVKGQTLFGNTPATEQAKTDDGSMNRGKDTRFRWGLATVLIIVIGSYLGFTKNIPFTTPFQLNAVFESANSIRPGSPVRIAGVAIGKVKSVEPLKGSDAAVVKMELIKKGLPIHTDATAKIRPRIFLEGNFFVDLKPGTPAAPTFGDGDTIKVTNTATPVQLDQVLTALQDPTREDLRTILKELGTGLERGAPSLNRAYKDIAPSERDTSIVNEAFLGTQPDKDLARLINGLSRATEGLGRREDAIQDLVTDFSTTMGAFAAEKDNLQTSIRELGPTLETTNVALAQINDALPPTRAFARAILPGVRETPATLKAGFPWIAQTRKLVSKDELRGLAQDLSPTSRDTARFVDTSIKLFPQGDLLAKCVTSTILPAGDIVVDDQFKTGQPNYREFAYTLVGLAGEGQNMDANGGYVHFQPGGGAQSVALGDVSPSPIFGQVFPGTGTQPATPGAKPPYRTSTPCFKSKIPDVNGPQSRKGSFGTPAVTATPTPTPILPIPTPTVPALP